MAVYRTIRAKMIKIGSLSTIIGIISIYKNWLTVLADESRLAHSKYSIYHLRNGIKFKVRARTVDLIILREIWKEMIYTPKNFNISKNDVVVDIGAQIGTFSLYASKQAFNGKIISFEPTAENFKLLKRNLSINNISNVHPVNMAVSGKVRRKFMYLNGKNTGGHSFFFVRGKSCKVKVRTISLKEIFDKYKLEAIDFLKMDCEGAEFDILFDCPKRILAKINIISMEYHNIDGIKNVEHLSAFLRKNGFSVTVKPIISAKLPPIWLSMGTLYAKRKNI